MRSRKSFFKWAVVKNDLRHAWPLWLGITLPLVLFQLAEIVNSRIRFNNATLYDLPMASLGQSVRSLWIGMAEIALPINHFYGCAVAMMLLHTLFQSRSAVATHSLPVTRTQLFVSHCVSALIMELIPITMTLAVGLLGWLGLPGYPFRCLPMVGSYLCNMLFCFLWSFGLAALCGMITGRLWTLPVLYAVLSFLPMGLYLLWEFLCESFLFGFWGGYDEVRWLCPAYWMMHDVHTVWQGDIVTVVGSETVVICGLCGLVLLAAAYWLYRIRPLEAAGEVILFAPLKVFFRLLVSLCSGLLGSLLFVTIFNQDDYGGPWTYVYIVVFCGLGSLFMQMLLQRSFKVITRRLVGEYALLTAAICAVLGILQTGGLGYESRIPNPAKVTSAVLEVDGPVFMEGGEYSGGYRILTLTEPETIRQVTQWQEGYLAQNPDETTYLDRPGKRTEDMEYWRDYRRSYIRLTYHLSGGKSIKRHYLVSLVKDDLSSPATPDYQLNRIYEENMDISRIFPQPGEVVEEIYLDDQGIAYAGDGPDAQAILDAVRKDMEGKSLTVHLLSEEEQNGKEQPQSNEIRILWSSPEQGFNSFVLRLSEEAWPNTWAAAKMAE